MPEDGPHHELESGALIEVTRPKLDHNRLVHWLWRLIEDYILPQQLGFVGGDTLVVLDEAGGVIYAPDLFFIALTHLERVREGVVYGPPDLVVEVLSPTTSERDLGIKLQNYYRLGVPWYWTVDPDLQTIQERQWQPAGFQLTASVGEGEPFQPHLFPGMEIRLNEFRPLPLMSSPAVDPAGS